MAAVCAQCRSTLPLASLPFPAVLWLPSLASSVLQLPACSAVSESWFLQIRSVCSNPYLWREHDAHNHPLCFSIKLKSSAKVCVNPDAPWVKKLLKRIAGT